MKYPLILVIILFLPHSSLALPEGWRYPLKTDVVDTWAQHTDKLPEPYHIEADFNMDGIQDHIWVLINLDQKSYGLFAFMSSKQGKVVTIEIKKFSEGRPQDRGILYIIPGSMQNTACGLGIPECYPGDAYKLKMEDPTFQMFKYKGGSLFYYWDADKGEFRGDSIED